MTSTVNTELRDFQRTVRDHARNIAASSYAARPYVDEFLAAVGLTDFVDDVEVTVKVTVPASDEAAAQQQVESQLRGLYLPTGWSASVSA